MIKYLESHVAIFSHIIAVLIICPYCATLEHIMLSPSICCSSPSSVSGPIAPHLTQGDLLSPDSDPPRSLVSFHLWLSECMCVCAVCSMFMAACVRMINTDVKAQSCYQRLWVGVIGGKVYIQTWRGSCKSCVHAEQLHTVAAVGDHNYPHIMLFACMYCSGQMALCFVVHGIRSLPRDKHRLQWAEMLLWNVVMKCHRSQVRSDRLWCWIMMCVLSGSSVITGHSLTASVCEMHTSTPSGGVWIRFSVCEIGE